MVDNAKFTNTVDEKRIILGILLHILFFNDFMQFTLRKPINFYKSVLLHGLASAVDTLLM